MSTSKVVRRLAIAFATALVAIPLALPSRAARADGEKRDVSGFDRVRCEGAFDTEIVAGGSTTRVLVTGSPDVVARVTTDVRDHTLIVGMRSGSIPFGNGPKISIELPKLRGFENSGAGSTKISGISASTFALENSGAATISASGRAANVSISNDGTGKIDTTGLDARDATVDNDGVGSIRVRASGSLSMTVNGVGRILYAGNPAHIQKTVNGIGRIGPL